MRINWERQNHKQEKTPSLHEYKLQTAKSQTKTTILARKSINYEQQKKFPEKKN